MMLTFHVSKFRIEVAQAKQVLAVEQLEGDVHELYMRFLKSIDRDSYT